MIHYLFDGSYYGLLTAVFESFERKNFNVNIAEKDYFLGSMFDETVEIITDTEKAKRVLDGLKKKLKSQDFQKIYCAFLSEDQKARNAIFYIIQQLFKGQDAILDNFGDDQILYYHQTLKKVNREKHRMKAFIRFQKSNDGMYYCMVEPDFNVLPLILNFFKKRYADQPWLIYDVKRKYGLYYNLQHVEEVYLSPKESQALSTQTDSIDFDEKEEHFQTLWKQYFKSTNIEARKNMKLHLQHVPRRYWKYLVEKQD